MISYHMVGIERQDWTLKLSNGLVFVYSLSVASYGTSE